MWSQTQLIHVLGITKAYTTRVGEGPFPTELTDDSWRIVRYTWKRVRYCHSVEKEDVAGLMVC